MTIDNTGAANFLHDFQRIVLTNVLRFSITYDKSRLKRAGDTLGSYTPNTLWPVDALHKTLDERQTKCHDQPLTSWKPLDAASTSICQCLSLTTS